MALKFSEQNEYQKLVQLIIQYGGGNKSYSAKETLKEIKSRLKELYQRVESSNK